MKLSRERMTFDLRQRYRMTSELIESVRTKKPLRILDAGSREGFLRHYLPGDEVVNLDLEFFPGDSFVVGNLLNLPFARKKFDAVISLDVLEHIEPGRRGDFLDEMARAGRDYLIIGAPFHDEMVVAAEKLANDFYLRATGQENEFLAEHLRFGLPRLEEVEEWIQRRNYSCVTLPNNFLPFWQVMMALSAYFGSLPRSGNLMAAVTDLYDRLFAEYDYSYPAYRRILLISKSGDLDKEATRRQFAGKPFSEDSRKRAWDFAGRVLSELAPYQERALLELEEENNRFREEIAGLQQSQRELEEKLAAEKANYLITRVELEGIKNTPAYRWYRKTWGRVRDRLR